MDRKTGVSSVSQYGGEVESSAVPDKKGVRIVGMNSENSEKSDGKKALTSIFDSDGERIFNFLSNLYKDDIPVVDFNDIPLMTEIIGYIHKYYKEYDLEHILDQLEGSILADEIPWGFSHLEEDRKYYRENSDYDSFEKGGVEMKTKCGFRGCQGNFGIIRSYQLRSADENETQKCKCTTCGSWRRF